MKKIEPAKNVAASACGPTSWMYPGNGPTKKQSDPTAKQSDIQNSEATRSPIAAGSTPHGRHPDRRSGGASGAAPTHDGPGSAYRKFPR